MDFTTASGKFGAKQTARDPVRALHQDVKREVEPRVQEGIRAVREEVFQEEMIKHLQAGWRSPLRPDVASAAATIPGTSSLLQARSRQV